jgi:predicted MPP superfamily phosphohydrolase
MLLINLPIQVNTSQMLSNFTEKKLVTLKDMLVSSFQDVLHSTLKLLLIKLLLFLMLLVSNVGFMVPLMVLVIYMMSLTEPNFKKTDLLL